MTKMTSKRPKRKNTPHEQAGKRFCVCFNKYIIWTICFYFYFHLTVFDTLFIYVVLCDDKKEFIIHRILYEAGCDGDFMTLSSRRPSYFSWKAVFCLPTERWGELRAKCILTMSFDDNLFLWQIDFLQRMKINPQRFLWRRIQSSDCW